MTAADIVIILVLAAGFLIGFFQGVLRGALNIFAFAIAFLLAANLRDRFGAYLASQWTSYDQDYGHMLAFLIAAVIILVVLLVLIHMGTKGPKGVTSHPLLDDLLGGALGVVMALLLMGGLLIILTSYYGPEAPIGLRAGATWSANLYHNLLESRIGVLVNDIIVPMLSLLFGSLVPDVVRRAMA